jgi:hypothetical protein
MKTIQKNQKPIEIDASFKYRCSNINCDIEHWLFLRQAKVFGFKVVCECGETFEPETISSLDIKYADSDTISNNTKHINKNPESINEHQKRAISILTGLGYNVSKVNAIIDKYNNIDNVSVIVKQIIIQLGDK